VAGEGRILGARIGPDDVGRRSAVSFARVKRSQRLDERALAAAVLSDDERDARGDVEATLRDQMSNGRDGERPGREVGRMARIGRPVDALEMAGLRGHATAA
jgi:hypothetical protein